MSLTKADILKCEDLPREKVSVPEWKGHVWVRVLTGAEVDSLGTGNPSQARIAVLSICDKDGERLFNDKEVAALQAKSSRALRRVVEAALAINGLNEAASETRRKN